MTTLTNDWSAAAYRRTPVRPHRYIGAPSGFRGRAAPSRRPTLAERFAAFL